MTETTRTLLVTPLAKVEIRRQKWAATNQVPLGTVTILAGMAGIAKSTILAYYIAQWTKGEAGGDLFGVPALVALINGEDDLNTVLVPRLTAAGANLELVHSMSSITVHDKDGTDWITSPTLEDDLKPIREALIESGARILIIDPIISLMRGDSHRLDDVRKNLDPLASMAGELGIAVVCVAHFNKGAGPAADKVSGSHAFRDIARSLLLLAVDDETDERILTVEKSNYSPVKPSVAFRVDSIAVPTSDGEQAIVGRAVMLGASDITVQDLLRREATVLGNRSADLVNYVNQHPEGVKAEEVAEALQDLPIDQARIYLSRAASAGRIERAERGLYKPVRNSHGTSAEPVTSVTSVTNLLPYVTQETLQTGSGDVTSLFQNTRNQSASNVSSVPSVSSNQPDSTHSTHNTAVQSEITVSKVNGPCPECGQPSHWANAANNYIHPDCEPVNA